ncbi:MAG: GTP cyclohydrolase I FolE [Ruminococcus sp.]
MVDEEKIKKAVVEILEAIGEDPNREGLRETPSRVARMYCELASGYSDSAKKHLSKVFTAENSQFVLEKDISFHSLCEHHMLPFFGKVHIAYIPDGKVVGLSKLARLVEVFARRLQIQEQMTNQIADAIEEELAPKGVFVIVEAEHTCMTMRGIKKIGSKTVTLASRGEFIDNLPLQKNIQELICFD